MVVSSSVLSLGAFIVVVILLICCVVGFFMLGRSVKTLHQSLSSAQQGMQEVVAKAQQETQDGFTKVQQDVQEKVSQLQQQTQDTIWKSQQETHRVIGELRGLSTESQSVMVETKTLLQQARLQMAEWQKDTSQLNRALRSSHQQGLWGEGVLLQIVQSAGLQEHTHYEVQKKMEGGQQPDLIIHLHNNQSIAVDAKAPSQVYLDAMSEEEESARLAKLKKYSRSVRDKMNDLSKKEYWQHLQPAPALVVLFLPNEAMFRAALEFDHALLDDAPQRNVLLASPVTLIALLKTIAFGWSQEHRAQNVERIIHQSKTIHRELEGWLTQCQKLRKAMQTTQGEFNQLVVRYRTNVLPHLQELGEIDSTLTMNETLFQIEPLPSNLIALELEPEHHSEEHPTKILLEVPLKKWKTAFLYHTRRLRKAEIEKEGETVQGNRI